jgi:heme-degrading monooxygenase HmoA
MYARVTTLQSLPDRLDEGVRIFAALAPEIKSQQGFVSTLLLIDRAANKAIVVTLWETLADLEASEANRQQQLANPSVAALLAGAPVREVCEVAMRIT